MIRSMTGFGEASCQRQGVHYAIELRSLNNRYFKPSIRLPEPIAALESELETLLRKRLIRGSIVLNVRMAASESAAVSRVNDAALISYLEHLETIHGRIAKGDHNVQIDLTALLALPGVLTPAEDEASLLQKARPVVMEMVKQACERLLIMRATEGQALATDVTQQCQTIRERMETVIERAPTVIEEYHQRLSARIEELVARARLEMGKPELLREVAVFAERADISEETKRMAGHLEHFTQVLAADNGEPVGRTLDFIAQELLREANTIASKSNDALISRAIVDVKSAIDRIKEQVQNVE